MKPVDFSILMPFVKEVVTERAGNPSVEIESGGA
jgi:hypothetical protein